MKVFTLSLLWTTLATSLPMVGIVQAHGVEARQGNAKPAFDIVKTDVRVDSAKNWLIFSMQVSGKAGSLKPFKNGEVCR